MQNATPITQNHDVRLLGKMLGDVIRAYGGDKLYRQTEYIRSTSVDRFRRLAGADSSDRGLGALNLDDTLPLTLETGRHSWNGYIRSAGTAYPRHKRG